MGLAVPARGRLFHFRKKYMMKRHSLLLASAFLGLFAGTAQAQEQYAQSGMWAVYRLSPKTCYADLIDYTKPQGYGQNLWIMFDDGFWRLGTDFPVPNPSMTVYVDGSAGFPVEYESAYGMNMALMMGDLEPALKNGNTLNLNIQNEGPEYILEGSAWAMDMAYECAVGPDHLQQAMGNSVEWTMMRGGAIDGGPMAAGWDGNGDLFACLADHHDGRHPGKISYSSGGCLTGYGNEEWTTSEYFVAMNPQLWVPASNGNVPPNATRVGWEANGEPLYSCRTQFFNDMQVGKVRPGLDGCHFGMNGAELTIPNYEVLVE